MANNCYFEIRIKGSKKSCDAWVKRMKSYEETNHFYRIFSCDVYLSEYVDKAKDEYVMEMCGDCAWSLESCCRQSGYSGGIDLFAVNTAELNLKMEAFSEETGMCFQEHYIYEYGVCKKEICVPFYEYFFDENLWTCFEDFKSEYKLPKELKEIDFDENGLCRVGGFGEWIFSI